MDVLVFTWDYDKSIGPNSREILTPVGFSPSDEFNEIQVDKYKDKMKNIGFFSAFEKYVDEKTGEITLYKLMVPNPNPEESENPEFAIRIYKGDTISKLEITPSLTIAKFSIQAPLIYKHLNKYKKIIDLNARLGKLGF
jgi:hypothetical protein